MHTDTTSRSVCTLLRSRSSAFLIHRWRVMVLSTVVFSMSVAVADAETKKKMFSIEAQPARHSLTLYARQAQVQLGFAADVTDDIVTNSVIGEYDVSQALELLLEGTGLQAEHGERGIIIRPIRRAERAGSVDEPATAVAETTSLKLVKSLTLPSARATQQSIPSAAGGSGTNKSAQPAEELDNIIVTGTSIRGVTNPASPVITFTRQDIDRSGLATLPEFIQTIPQNFNGGFTDVTGTVPGAAGPNGNSTQGTGIDLRGLGAEATLTLLNGRRLAPAGVGRFTDISTIPASAVDRIEVVLDGASAIYGADAVGGVVNIILRDDLEGAETAVRYETVTDGGRDSWRGSQALGTSWGSGSVFASYEFLTQAPLKNSERSFTADAAFPYDIASDNEIHNAFVSFSQELFGTTTLFTTANYSTRDTFTNSATIDVNTRDFTIDQYGGVAGLEWELPGSWLVEVSTAFNRYESDSISTFPNFDILIESALESEVWSWDAKADGDIFDLPGGAVKLAFGAGTRNEKFVNNDTPSERDVRYAFAESLIPLVQPNSRIPGVNALEVSAAVRHEDYDDFGSSTDGKLGIVWTPIDGLQLRSTFGTSFRAPLLFESRPGRTSTAAVNAIDPQSPTGTTPGLLLTGSALSSIAPELGTPLQPEESETLTIGVDFAPSSWTGFSASVSYFEIDFTDRIAAPGANFTNVLVEPAFSSVVTLNPTANQIDAALAASQTFRNFTDIPDDELLDGGVAFLYDGRVTNLAGTTNRGLDLQVSYTRGVGQGNLGISLTGTYLLELEDRITPTATPLDRLNRYQNPIDLRLRGGLSWSTDRLNTSLFVNYADRYEDDRQTPESSISSFTTVDWTIGYELGGTNTPPLLRNVRLLFGAVNLFDRDPPFVDGSSNLFNINFDRRNASPFGRVISLQFTKDWLGDN